MRKATNLLRLGLGSSQGLSLFFIVRLDVIGMLKIQNVGSRLTLSLSRPDGVPGDRVNLEPISIV